MNQRCRCLFLAFLTVWIRPLSAGRDDSKAEGSVEELAERVYVRLGNPEEETVSNSGFVVLPGGVAVYDTHFTPEAGHSLLEEIEKVTSKPVRYVINSHFHPDHTHGNQAFPATATVFASTFARKAQIERDLPAMKRSLEAARQQLERMKKDLESQRVPDQLSNLRTQITQREKFVDRLSRQRVVPAVACVEDSVVIHSGGSPLHLMYLGKGHTDGDVILYLPSEKIVFTGDLFFNAAFPNARDAHLLDWIVTLDALLQLDAETFVPGHGPVGGREQVRNFRQYLQDLRNWVEPAVNRGETMEQVLRDTRMPEKYAAYAFGNFFSANLQKMYIELKSRQ